MHYYYIYRGEKVAKKWVGSDKILVAICSVLDLYNCPRLVSGVQHPASLQEMVYILFNFSLLLTEISPSANKTEHHNTFHK